MSIKSPGRWEVLREQELRLLLLLGVSQAKGGRAGYHTDGFHAPSSKALGMFLLAHQTQVTSDSNGHFKPRHYPALPFPLSLSHTWVFHVQEFLSTVETSPRGLHFGCWNGKKNSNLETVTKQILVEKESIF